jgi:hypothetical protein
MIGRADMRPVLRPNIALDIAETAAVTLAMFRGFEKTGVDRPGISPGREGGVPGGNGDGSRWTRDASDFAY